MATSDEFDGDLSAWTEVDPDNAGTFATDAGNLELVHAADTDTDLWIDVKNAPRLVQAVTTPLDISTKLVALPGEAGGVGLAVFDAARTNLVRLDYFTDGGDTSLFFAHINGGGNEIGHNAAVAGDPLWLRIVMPDGDSAEAYTSPDGDTWALLDTLDLTIDGAVTVAEAGPYGSGAFSPFPGSTYAWEHVRFDLAPGGGGGEVHAGDGLPASVTLTPGAGQGTSAITGTGQAAGMVLTPATGSGTGEGQESHSGNGLAAGVTLTPAAGAGTPQLSGTGQSATVLLTPGTGVGSPALVGAGLACTLTLTPGVGSDVGFAPSITRTLAVPADPRTLRVPAEDRTLTIPAEDRSLVVQPNT